MLVDDLVEANILKTTEIIHAFKTVDRANFLPKDMAENSEENVPIPIGEGQTNSQPMTVALMLELVNPRPGEEALDVGFGSGWTTALLAKLVGDTGKVVAIEILPAIFAQGQENVQKVNLDGRVEFLQGSYDEFVKENKIFDCIMVSAAAPSVPANLKASLKDGGRLVIPVESGATGDHVLVKVTREGDNFVKEEFSGFQFVPLV